MLMGHNFGFREVVPDQSLNEVFKEITLTTGGTQSTLEDIKGIEKAGGYAYLDTSKHYTRNRFISWRIFADTLELIEQSLDVNLTGNLLRYRFIDSSLIDGISIHETKENVIILVPTVCSVHKFIFPHPSVYHKNDDIIGTHPNFAAPSIFSRISADSRDSHSFYIFNNSISSVDQLPSLTRSCYFRDRKEAIFIISYAVVELLLIKLNANGIAECIELHDESKITKFITGITEKFSSRTKQSSTKQVTSILIQQIQHEVYAIVFLRNGYIRIWSCTDGSYITSVDLTNEIHFVKDNLNFAILKNSLKGIPSESNEDTIALFMSFPSECQFHILKLVVNDDDIEIKKIQTLSPMESNLIDFSIEDNHLWSAWNKSTDEWVMYNTSIKTGVWIPIVKDTQEVEINPPSKGAGDHKQIYLQYLFHSGRFPLHIIKKSLTVYKNTSFIIKEMNACTVAKLKQAITLLIDNDIQQRLTESFGKDDDYLEYSQSCWHRFYAYCLQFYQDALRPLGIISLPNNSAAIVINKASISFLRPMEVLEFMTLLNDYVYCAHLICSEDFKDDTKIIEDIKVLFDAMAYLNKELSQTFLENFELGMAESLKPNVVMCDLIEDLKMSVDNEYNDVCHHVTMLLNQCSDLYLAITKILEILRCDKLPQHYHKEFSNRNISPCFNSPLAASLVSTCLRQQSETRFSICRNLLLICSILNDCKTLMANSYEAIYSVCEPEIIYLTQANYLLLWLTKLPALNNAPQEINLHRLNPIKLMSINQIHSNGHVFSLIELFALTVGGQEARKCFLPFTDYSKDITTKWDFSLLLFTDSLRHILWPLNGNILLAEWMVINGQHIWLQQYVRNLSNWCEWNMSSYSFLLAVSFLMSGENYKALDYFTIAAKGILDEPFLRNKIIKEPKDGQNIVNYYLKVIQLFEMHKSRDCAIEMANIALNIVKEGNPLLSTIHSIKFKHHLSLRHYERAFYALKDNPEQERKKDNLRDFVKTLLDEKRFDILLNFTYGDMDELFTTILLTRARATDPVENVFYDFLYSYQIKRGPLCYRLAASVMCERAYRLSYAENCDALEKQIKCYLAAKNVLLLVDREYAWIVRPSDPDEEDKQIVLESLAGSEEPSRILKTKKQIEVVNVETIDKELIFAYSKLKLCRFDSTIPTTVTNAVELVTLLNSSGLFKVSLEICSAFNLSYVPVFEALTLRCITLSEEENANAWEWLIENDLQNLPANRESLSEVVWKLLQVFLEKYEEDNSTVLHKVVCRKIISMRSFIPFWLLTSYKIRNPSELLKILHLSGRLDEAFEIAKGYLLAALGQRKEIYGFKMSLNAVSPPLSLPVYELQCLIKEYQMQNEQNVTKPFENEYQILQTLFEKYLSTASRISIVLK